MTATWWKPGAKHFFLVSHMGSGAQECRLLPLLSRHNGWELDQKRISWDLNWQPYGMLASEAVALAHYVTTLAFLHSYCELL